MVLAARHAESGADHGMHAAMAVTVQMLPAQGKQRLHTLSSRSACQAKEIAIKYAAGACVVNMFQATTSAGHDGSNVLLRMLGAAMRRQHDAGSVQCCAVCMLLPATN
jgi:hypothetical protein